MRFVAFDKLPEILRLSSVLRRCRNAGQHDVAATVEQAASRYRDCSKHGRIDDPIVATLADAGTLIIACPFCSSPEVLAAWRAEGRTGAA